MLLKEEFTANLSYLEPSINAMLYAGEGNNLIDDLFSSVFTQFCFIFNIN